MTDILAHSVATSGRESKKSSDPVILVAFGLLVIALLIVTVASAFAPPEIDSMTFSLASQYP
jgi:hypothetical protein